MVLEKLDATGKHPENQEPSKQSAITKAEIFLNYPIPKEAEGVVSRVRELGMGGNFAAYRLSGTTLEKDSNFPEWKIKPEDWYWEQIANGKIAPGSAKLPDAWILVDKTQRPDYGDGKQLYENDPFGPLLKKLRKEGKILNIKGIPEASRFGIYHDELTQVVLPEIAKLLGIESSKVRLPKAIEFNILGNQFYPNWGKANTWEWFADNFESSHRFLVGGGSGHGGLAHVRCPWTFGRSAGIGFRPLVVVSSKA